MGRNTIEVITTWKELTEKGIMVVCRNPNVRNFNDQGGIDIFSDLMISILSTMSSFEKSLIKERQLEGIKIRKAKGLYQGRKINTTDSVEKFLEKPKSKMIIDYLNRGYKHREICKLCDCSSSTISKVQKALVA